jgi:hypothetical protein
MLPCGLKGEPLVGGRDGTFDPKIAGPANKFMVKTTNNEEQTNKYV